MTSKIWIIALGAMALVACGQNGGAGGGASVTPQTEDQKTYYALGLMMGRNLKQFDMNAEDLEYVKAGLSDQALGKTPQVELQTYGPKVQQLAMSKQKAGAAKQTADDATAAAAQKAKDKPFEDAAAKEAGATVMPSGLVFRTLKPGTGENPKATDTVKVNYEGKTTDGKVFDSSYTRGQPATFPLTGVVPCWTEGVQHMKVGETAQLTCPSKIAYGDHGHPPTIPGGATLSFKVELLEIVKGVPPPLPGMHPPGGPGAPHSMPIHMMPPHGMPPGAAGAPPPAAPHP